MSVERYRTRVRHTHTHTHHKFKKGNQRDDNFFNQELRENKIKWYKYLKDSKKGKNFVKSDKLWLKTNIQGRIYSRIHYFAKRQMFYKYFFKYVFL